MIKKLFLASALGLGAFYYGQTVVFNADFETAAGRSLWTIGDRDGDSETWEFLDATANEVDSFQGYFAASFSWYWDAFTPDNILTSPSILLPASDDLELSFKVASGDEELYDEHYAVYVIPANSTFTGAETPVFEETLDGGYLDAAKVINVDVSSFSGQEVKIVFRHFNCTDIFYIGIDDITITKDKLAVSDYAKNKISIFPNPSSDFIKISNASNVKLIRIFDMNGRLIKETTSTEIDIQNFGKGQYILNIHTGNDITSRKFIKK
ncbi:MAG: choice-of-anchor J domain-containing protein [Weeksellaceae bacterium]|nr:choice-of-anchor J domain-containing protein [Bacteroidota bacterium]MCG2780133.1 choice-of-anchor J domain-containing protein [Weeksellaceae bacterium]